MALLFFFRLEANLFFQFFRFKTLKKAIDHQGQRKNCSFFMCYEVFDLLALPLKKQ